MSMLATAATWATAAVWFLCAAAGRTSTQLFIPSETPLQPDLFLYPAIVHAQIAWLFVLQYLLVATW